MRSTSKLAAPPCSVAGWALEVVELVAAAGEGGGGQRGGGEQAEHGAPC